jgi:hypothetical protein
MFKKNFKIGMKRKENMLQQNRKLLKKYHLKIHKEGERLYLMSTISGKREEIHDPDTIDFLLGAEINLENLGYDLMV